VKPRVFVATNGNSFSFKCPGCKEVHRIPLHRWALTGPLEAPSVYPSMNITWTSDDDGEVKARCHSIITDGKITFTPDTMHALKGQTVDLPDWST
jgi:hypothetical protein